ncbi:hypothetical protein LSH36_453g02056 [Paralvinella palmiformis]|uniref:G-protein coupled receptors family 1 profile domain-containing protein n=1 Tax=Paralvinella palmiformis TaxID=53620 RepID=A0AAD9JAC9_9ANNE|nr:hypothetical protein LSH36_453g02056 [Paralvinella palmiformis]
MAKESENVDIILSKSSELDKQGLQQMENRSMPTSTKRSTKYGVKRYTDLLAGGAINDADDDQPNFDLGFSLALWPNTHGDDQHDKHQEVFAQQQPDMGQVVQKAQPGEVDLRMGTDMALSPFQKRRPKAGQPSSRCEYSRAKEKLQYAPWVAIPYAIILGVFAIIGTFGNILIIGSMMSGSNRHVVGNFFIVNLAICDMVVTLIINPMAIVGVIMGKLLYDGYYWSCKFLGSLCVVVCICSLLNIGAISINRYTFIVHNATYNKIYTKFSTIMMCILVWMLAYLVDMPAHLRWSDHGFDMKTNKCLWDRTLNWYYTMFLIVVGIIFPLVVIVFFYALIFRHINAAKKRLTACSKGDKTNFRSTMKQAKMMFIIFICFTSCWLPYVIVLIFDRYDRFPIWVHLYASLTAHLHASINFIIYGVSNRKIRLGYTAFIYKYMACCIASKVADIDVDVTVLSDTDGMDGTKVKEKRQGFCGRRRVTKIQPADETIYTIEKPT